MKAILKMALIAMPLLLVACDDDVKEPGKNPVGPGDGVQFTLSAGNESRTVYDDQWNPTDNLQGVYWGNYIASEKDNIKVFCDNTLKNQIATYEVTPNTSDGNKNIAAYITNLAGESGSMQWGNPGTVHNFYAFYPAEQAGDKFTNGNTIRATVSTGQSPTSYRAVMGSTVWQEKNVLQEVENNSAFSTDNKTTVYGNPDMTAAIMVAKTSVTAQNNNDPVPLNFNVLADVIDITLNGPVTPNQLSGNANPDDSNTAIKIYTVTLEAYKTVTDDNGTHTEVDDSKIISGSFDLNMETGEISNPVGNATVQLQTSAIYKETENGKEKEVQYYPTLHARASVTGSPSADQVDQLRLRAFIIPGSIKNLSELQVRVMTNFGEYVQPLSDFSLNNTDKIKGKIYPIKLGYFYYRGTQFDLSRWIGQLNPNIFISELSIPGAWHASNENYQGNASKDFQAQYNAGVRAFEVHTINGTQPYTDWSFGTQVTSSNVQTMQFYEDELNHSEKNDFDVQGGEQSRDGFFSTSWTGTNKTVTEYKYVSYQQMPKIALRLYRSRNITSSTINPDVSFSDALIALANVMNPDGLMFFEFGFERGADGVTHRPVTVPCKTITTTYKRQKTGVTLKGTSSGVTNDVTWDTSNVFSDDDSWELESKDIPTYNETLQLEDGKAWCIAVESCLSRLKNTNGAKTQQPILYTDEVTPYTTIAKVKGKVIVKINTNNAENETVGIGWSGNTPALFSRWMKESEKEPLTVNLQWGSPVEPTPLKVGDYALRWCFSELDNVGNNAQGRKDAIDQMNGMAYQNYKGGLHRTFYETSLGGFLNGSVSEYNCLKLAEELNPYALKKITNPSRNACPLGLVFMNYVIPPTGQEDTYKSADLIRAIINNNASFLLNRDSGTGGTTNRNDVRDNTNASFDNATGTLSPLR